MRRAPAPCDRDGLKNVTVARPEDVYRRARIKAAERGTSLSALAREFLVHLGEEESDFERRALARGAALREAHRRVRRAGRATGVSQRVEPKLPVDVLGVYAYPLAGV